MGPFKSSLVIERVVRWIFRRHTGIKTWVRARGVLFQALPFLIIKTMKLYEVLERLDRLAPFESAESWDNVGLMFGDPMQEIGSVVVALDPFIEVIEYAKDHSFDLIISHHPLFFKPLNNINLSMPLGRKISMLAEFHIALVSMHTNLDISKGGVADTLAQVLGLREVEDHGLMRVGLVESPCRLDEWVRSLPFEHARIVDSNKEVRRVGLCPGSGMDLWADALRTGCDTFVTGDVRYHSAVDAWEAGLNVVDLGHSETEVLVVEPLVDMLIRVLDGVGVYAFEQRPLIRYIRIQEKETQN